MKIRVEYTFETPDGHVIEYADHLTAAVQDFTDRLGTFSGFAFHKSDYSAWYPAKQLTSVKVREVS